MNDEEKLILIREALADAKSGNLTLLAFFTVVSGIVDPLANPNLFWGLEKLNSIMARQGVVNR